MILSLLFGLSTLVWAYSQTSLNSVPAATFLLLSLWFFRKYQKNKSISSLSLCAISIAFGYLIRPDAVMIIIILFIYLLIDLRRNNKKIKKLFVFVLPIITVYAIQKFQDYLNFGVEHTGFTEGSTTNAGALLSFCPATGPIGTCTVLYEGAFGSLFSPGVGLFIFAPILFTIFFSFPEFYKKNKKEFFLFISFIGFFLWYYGQADAWHGLSGWGARYMLLLIPFFLLPLGVSIENRGRRFIILLAIVGVIGASFNVINLIQDVPYFVWGKFGAYGSEGLYGLGLSAADKYSVHTSSLWTFRNSQLTHSIILAFNNLQIDIFLIKFLGIISYSIIFIGSIFILSAYLLKTLRAKTVSNTISKEN